MHRTGFITFPIDWDTHTPLDTTDVVSTIGEWPSDTKELGLRDLMGAKQITPHLSLSHGRSALCSTLKQPAGPKVIEDRWKFPMIEGCICRRHRCKTYQLDLFWDEYQGLVKERAAIEIDLPFTLNHEEYFRLLKRLDELPGRLADMQKRMQATRISMWFIRRREERLCRQQQQRK